MLVSVIICTYSRKRLADLLAAVGSLCAQTYRCLEILVIVDHNEELFRELPGVLDEEVLIISNQTVKGLSGSRNCGIAAAHGKIMVFFDDDAVASLDWIEKLVEPFADERVMAVGGRVLPYGPQKVPGWFPEEFLWVLGCTYKGHPEERGPIRNVFGGNCAFRKSCIERVGHFLPALGRVGDKLLTGEETEYCMRIRTMMPTSIILYQPEAIVYHRVPKEKASFKYLLKRTYGSGYSLSYIHKILPAYGKRTEKNYLKHLLAEFLPTCLKGCFHAPIKSVSQLGAVIAGILSTGLGYLNGSLTVLKGIEQTGVTTK